MNAGVCLLVLAVVLIVLIAVTSLSLSTALMIAAVILFLFAAFPIPVRRDANGVWVYASSPIGLGWLGLACWALAVILAGHVIALH